MPDALRNTIPLPGGFVSAISHASSVEAVMAVGTEWVPRILPTERCAICVFDENVVLEKVYRLDGVKELERDQNYYDVETTHRQVLAAGEPVFNEFDQLPDDAPARLHELHEAGFRSGVIVPMRSVGRTIGTISLCSSEKRFYGGTDAEKLSSIGKLLASQAQLMQTARDSVRRAETDSLTGLANRARLMRVLDGPNCLSEPDQTGRIPGLMQIDLDHFKEVNDTHGHAAGDAILKHAAAAMIKIAGPKDIVARLGGDEFVIVTRSDARGAHLKRLAEKIAAAVSKPIEFNGVPIRVGASIGTAMATQDAGTANRLISNADMALYEVKRTGRGGVSAFNAKLREASDRRIRLITGIKAAASTRAFEPYFQPQVCLETGRFSGFEILARWPHPELGLLNPREFIDLVAEADLSREIDKVVRQKGLAALSLLRRLGWNAPKMSFNASAFTLDHPKLVETLLDEVETLWLCPQDLVIEVREGDLKELGPDKTFQIITDLAESGFNVELDDFGAGLASMATLARTPVSAIKLDESLIALLPNARAAKILGGAVSLADELGLSVVAEGVETAAQYNRLKRLGCHYAQGYGISKPLPLDELLDLLQESSQKQVSIAS